MVAKKKKRILLAAVAAILLGLVIWIAWGNTALQQSTYSVCSRQLPKCFDGFRIAHVSDLHNTQIGKNNETLLSMLREMEPDMIAITGDLIDARNTDVEVAVQFAREAVKIAPCYYVEGNHEARMSDCSTLKTGLEEAGVTILEDAKTEIALAEEKITLIGVQDPCYQTDYLFGDAETIMAQKLAKLHTEQDGFTILLSHRPELFTTYAESGPNLVLSGHAHGGQFRLPFIGGVFAPNQGLFPEYDAGSFVKEDTTMIVSRGVGNSLLPFRVNNRPEVVLIELKTES